jgi:hypothetical protein
MRLVAVHLTAVASETARATALPKRRLLMARHFALLASAPTGRPLAVESFALLAHVRMR